MCGTEQGYSPRRAAILRDLSSAAMAALSDVEGVEDDVERSMGDSRRLELIAPPLSAADPDPVPDTRPRCAPITCQSAWHPTSSSVNFKFESFVVRHARSQRGARIMCDRSSELLVDINELLCSGLDILAGSARLRGRQEKVA